MTLEEFEKAWNSEPHGRIAVDLPSLAKEARREEAKLRRTVLRRDLREVGTCLILIPLFLFAGLWRDLPWTWFLGIPAALFVATFMLVDRAIQKHLQCRFGDSLRECLERSIADVEHQIKLLRNVFWWYLLPFDIACGTFFLQVGWNLRESGFVAVIATALSLGFLALVTWGIYRLNQRAVRVELQPLLQSYLATRACFLEAEDERRDS